MTPERARQIDAEEFRRDSQRALERALAYSQQKKDERRRQFLVTIYGEEGKTMPLWSTLPKEDEEQPIKPEPKPKPKTSKPRTPNRLARHITVNGETRTAREWAKVMGIGISTLFARAKKLGDFVAAVDQGGKQRRTSTDLITHNGLSLTRKEWAHRLGINYEALCSRIHKHGLHKAIAMGGPGGNRRQPANDNASVVTRSYCRLDAFEATSDHAEEAQTDSKDQGQDCVISPHSKCSERRLEDHHRDAECHQAISNQTHRVSNHSSTFIGSATTSITNLQIDPLTTGLPGVVGNFEPFEGTGAGAVLQETPKIAFHDKAKS